MRTPISTPQKFVGRSSLKSGPIVRSSSVSSSSPPDPNPPVYGLVLSMSNPASEDDFLVEELLGATLENVDLAEGEDPYFTILGGYFCKRLPDKGEVDISKIFGIALDSSKGFNLQPGNHSIVDEWEREDQYNDRRKSVINERAKGKDGWTFIVNYKPSRHMYPLGCGNIGLSRDCPQITELTIDAGTVDKSEQVVSATATVSSGHVDKYIWDWGDGNVEETSTNTATHAYSRVKNAPANYKITVTAKGSGTCESRMSHDVPTPPEPCPEIKFKSLVVTNIDSKTAQVDVSVRLLTDSKPDQYKWVWKDGTETFTDEPNATHIYPRKNKTKEYDIKSVALGPGDCVSRAHCVATIDPPACPEVIDVTQISDQLTDTHYTVTLQVNVKDPKNLPASFDWDWKDQTTDHVDNPTESDLQISHTYKRPEGNAETHQVAFNTTMPGDCVNGPTITIPVTVPGVCPELIDLIVNKGDLTDTTQQVSATVRVSQPGPMPASYAWTWGDEAPNSPPDVTYVPKNTHTYQRPAGDSESYDISVQTSGPGDNCDDNVSGKTTIPGTCPVIEKITFTVLEKEGDTVKVQFTAHVTGPDPENIVWNLGKNIPEVSDAGLVVEHTYTLPYDGTLERRVSVTLSGPDNCGDTASLLFRSKGPHCPVIQSLKYEMGDSVKGSITVHFTLDPGKNASGNYTWDFGDKSTPITSSDTTISHTYKQSYGEDDSYPVTVTSESPGTCKGSICIHISVPHLCPKIGALKIVSQERNEDGKHFDVSVNLDIISPVGPVSYYWNWGDDSSEEKTDSPTASHSYSRTLGKDRSRHIYVRTEGPGDCEGSATSCIVVPKYCPTIVAVKATAGQKDGDKQPYTFEVELSEGTASAYIWNWGDGSKASEPYSNSTAEHVYDCLAEQEKSYPVRVQVNGPGDCVLEGETSVMIPGCQVCPLVTRIDFGVEESEKGERTFVFVPAFSKGTPDICTWDFGYKTPPVETNEPEIEHTFPKSSEEKTYVVALSTKGPKDCAVPKAEVHVTVPPTVGEPKCPEITGIEIIGVKNLSDTETEVTVKAKVKGGTPSQFVWNWEGSDTSKTTESPEATLIFKRPEQDATCAITVATSGPGDCSGEAKTSVRIEGCPSPSLYCRLWRFLIAFLGALAIGAAIICVAAEILDQGEPSWSVGILTYTGLAIFFFGAALMWWMMKMKTQACPPTRCDWLALGWTMALAALTVVFFMLNCFASWIPWAIVFFVLLGVFGFLWFRDCAAESKARTFFTYFFIGIIAAVINMFLIAGPALTCC